MGSGRHAGSRPAIFPPIPSTDFFLLDSVYELVVSAVEAFMGWREGFELLRLQIKMLTRQVVGHGGSRRLNNMNRQP